MIGDKPSIGRIVRFVTKVDGESLEAASIITEVADPSEKGVVSLCVFTPREVVFKNNVEYDESGAPETWHWPPLG